jgi:hypothetical protein
MRKSDSTYEDIETDDPVALTEKLYRRELMEEQKRRNDRDSEGKGTGQTSRPRSIVNTVDMIAEVLNSEPLQSAFASLITKVLDSDKFQKACQTLLKNLWNDLVNDPETTAQVVQLLLNAIQNKEIQRSVKKLVLQIINDEEVYDELTRLLVRLGQEKQVLDSAILLLTESAHTALNDPEILDHSMEFATDVVGDDIVQRTSGEALRNTVSYAMQPSLAAFLSMIGVGLLLFGLSALANSRATDQEAVIVEKALSTVARNIQTSTLEGLSALMAIPGKLLTASLSFLSKIANFPVQMMQQGLLGLGQAGEQVLSAVARLLGYLASLPSTLLNATLLSFGRAGDSVSKQIGNALGNLWVILSVSFVGATFRSIGSFAVTSKAAVSSGFVALSVSMLSFVSHFSSAFTTFSAVVDFSIKKLAMTTNSAIESAVRIAQKVTTNAIGFAVKIAERLSGKGKDSSI